ncbi:nucleophile aminohydrolase [Vibrio phage 1.101.O._10N.261.45.C6]|nr:nucleophile aminohydrolase [Vibrio phage 1.101.O._10N.261.45.C6]
MTCICGMIRNGHVYMAGDLMGSNGFTGRTYPDSKVFANGEFILGYTSSFRMGQILEWNWIPPLREEGITDRQYMQLNVIESIRETFSTFGYGTREGLESVGGTFLIGYRGCLYEMQENFSLLSIPDFVAVGSGQYHAEAILYNTKDNEDFHPFEIMQTAIETAAHFTQSVSYECTVFTSDTEDTYMQEVEEVESVFVEVKTVEVVVDMHRYEILPSGVSIDLAPSIIFESIEELFDYFDVALGTCSLKRLAKELNVDFAPNIGSKTLLLRVDQKVKEIQQSLIDNTTV